MLDSRQNFVPILTSEAGSSLTTLNWEEVNTTCAAYYLEPLLIKPGYEFLRTLSHMGHYLNWNGSLILNASSFTANKEGVFTLISPFDGSKIKLDYAQLIKLINHLQPDVVVLPSKTLRDFPQIWTDWNASITPFISVDDVHMNTVSIPYGVYFVFEEKSSVSIEQLGRWSQVPRYVMGAIDLPLMNIFLAEGVDFIESDYPAKAGLEGFVFSKKGIIDLKVADTSMQFELIDKECSCPTCSQNLSQAYLHHLYHHTPLLCQRFLIQHNVHHVQNFLIK